MSLAYQVKPNLYLGLDPDKEPIKEEQQELYVNHSCDGNCWYEVSQRAWARAQCCRCKLVRSRVSCRACVE